MINRIRSGLVAVLMLTMLFGSVVSKDLYHLLLPHSNSLHVNDPFTVDTDFIITCEDTHPDCFICKFEFSNSHDQVTYTEPDQLFSYQEITAPPACKEFISITILSRSLRAPPSVI